MKTQNTHTSDELLTSEERGHSLSPDIFETLVEDIVREFGALRFEEEPVVDVLLCRGHAYEFGATALARVREVEQL